MTATILAALALVAVIVTAWFSRRRMQEIHVLVNRRLEVALQEIEQLKADKARTALKETGSAPVVPSDAGRADDP